MRGLLPLSIGLMVALGTVPAARANVSDDLKALQDRARVLGSAEAGSARECREARQKLRTADEALTAQPILSDVSARAKAVAAAQEAQRTAEEACDRHENDERLWNLARVALREAMSKFDSCVSANASDACLRISALARENVLASASPSLADRHAVAKDAQATVTKLKESAEKAYKLSDKAITDSLGYYEKADTNERRRELLEKAQLSHQSADAVYRASRDAQSLSNQLVEDVLHQSLCELGPKDPSEREFCAKGDDRGKRSIVLGAALARHKEESAVALEKTKLAAFQVQADVLNAGESERRAALAFLQLVDRNPDARGLFGAEAIRVSAGKKGAEASIRLDLDKFVNSSARDLALIVSAPVSDGGSTAFYSSANGVASDAKATLAYRFTPRLLSKDRVFNYLYQFGVQATLGYSSNPYRSPDDIAKVIADHGTPRSIGTQVVYADTKGTLLHQLGVDYKVQRSYGDDVTKVTRCPPVPAGQMSVACVNDFFEPIKQRSGLEFNYGFRHKTDSFAYAPTLTYTRRTRVTALEIPVYLIGDVEKKSLTAGVALSHSTSGRDGIAAKSEFRLFLGSPFSLFGD